MEAGQGEDDFQGNTSFLPWTYMRRIRPAGAAGFDPFTVCPAARVLAMCEFSEAWCRPGPARCKQTTLLVLDLGVGLFGFQAFAHGILIAYLLRQRQWRRDRAGLIALRVPVSEVSTATVTMPPSGITKGLPSGSDGSIEPRLAKLSQSMAASPRVNLIPIRRGAWPPRPSNARFPAI